MKNLGKEALRSRVIISQPLTWNVLECFCSSSPGLHTGPNESTMGTSRKTACYTAASIIEYTHFATTVENIRT